jgi:hypothetical protein
MDQPLLGVLFFERLLGFPDFDETLIVSTHADHSSQRKVPSAVGNASAVQDGGACS